MCLRCFLKKNELTLFLPLSFTVLLFITLISLIILIKWFPYVTIPGFIFNSIKLSDVPIVKYGWANYIIYSVMVSGIICHVIDYFQKVRPKKIVKVSDKDDPKKNYDIPIGTLKEAPLVNEVIDVLVEG